MDKKNGWDYSKVTEEDIERAERAKDENEYTILGLIKEIAKTDRKEGEE